MVIFKGSGVKLKYFEVGEEENQMGISYKNIIE